jgi:hypothetical protein
MLTVWHIKDEGVLRALKEQLSNIEGERVVGKEVHVLVDRLRGEGRPCVN